MNAHLSVLLAAWAVATASLSFASLPAQARAKLIGLHQTDNGTGVITGTSRLVQACGQAAAPVLAAQLYVRVGPWAPWAAFAAVQGAVLALYPILGVALDRDPDWKAVALAARAMPKAELV